MPTQIICAIDCDGIYDPHQLKGMIPMLGPGIHLVTAYPYHDLGDVLNVPEW